MRYLLALMLLWATTTVGIAEENKPGNFKQLEIPILCGKSQNMLGGLRERYNEEIMFLAPSTNEIGDNLFHSLWINTETTTWSFIVVNKEKDITCIISSGDQFRTISVKPGVDA